MIRNIGYGFSVACLLCAVVLSCGRNDAGVAVERIDIAAMRYLRSDSAGRDSIEADFRPAMAPLASMAGVPVDSAMTVYARSRAQEVFAPDVSRRLTSMASEEKRLGGLWSGLGKEMPEVSLPVRVYGFVTPYNQSVVLADSVMFVGLNHYLGYDYEGYEGFEDYRRRLKEPERMPVDVAEAIVASAYPYRGGEGATALSRMLYEGALVEAMMRVLPDADIEEVMGYDDGQMKWVRDNEPQVWDAMITRALLYSVDPMDAERLVALSPSTSVVHPMSPGRLGRYIGYRIVDSYVEKHPGVSLEWLLSPEFYMSRSSLIDAGYTPSGR